MTEEFAAIEYQNLHHYVQGYNRVMVGNGVGPYYKQMMGEMNYIMVMQHSCKYLIKKLIKNKSEESKEYNDIIGNNLETEDIKLEIDLNGSERTFTINKLENAVPARDITDELDEGDDGHRTFESIHKKGKEYADDIFRAPN